MLFVPPNLAPLGIDLDRIHVSGAVPSTGEAHLLDGRSFSIYYRGGRLQLTWIKPGPDASPETVFLDEIIGPPFDGCITAGQVGELLGLRLRGKALLTDPTEINDAEWETSDLSGRTTYWHEQVRLTAEDAEEFLLRLHSKISGQVNLRRTLRYDAQGEPTGYQLLPFSHMLEIRTFETLVLLPSVPPETALLAEGAGLYRVSVELWPGWNEYNRPPFDKIKVNGRTYDISGPHGSIFNARFLTADAEAATFIHHVLGALESYCSRRVTAFNLATGEILQTEEDPMILYGPRFAEWCLAANNRFVAQSSDEQGHRVGYRPAK